MEDKLNEGLTEEEQDFMEMIIDCEMQTPEAFNEVKPFAEISISRATIFSALVDYAKSRQDYKQSIIGLIDEMYKTIETEFPFNEYNAGYKCALNELKQKIEEL